MYTPPSDDEQPVEDKPAEKATKKVSRVRSRQDAKPRKTPEEPREEFYADEHPEIPRIRRASRNKDRVEMLPTIEMVGEENSPAPGDEFPPQTLTARKRARKEAQPPTGQEDEPASPMRSGETSAYTRLIRQQNRREMLPFTGLEDPREFETGVQEMVGQQTSRHSPKTPDPLRRDFGKKAANRRARRPGRAGGSLLGSSRNKLLLGLLAMLVMLIGAPLLLNTLHNALTPPRNPLSGAGVSLAKLQSVPSNPRELIIQPPTSTHPAPPILATSAYLLDAQSAATYYTLNPFLHLPMLSTTKLMTAALAVEDGNLDQQITITADMEKDINQLSADSALFGVKQGETYTLRDLLYGLLFVSGNDAALAIADALAGNVQSFVAQMNQKAQVLGLHDTHFVNPHGLLDPGQYSCARDLAVLGLFSLSIPMIKQISSQKTYHIPAGGKHDARALLNENQFLWWYPGVEGGKTGYDNDRDFVQVMQVTRNHHTMIGVVMHTNDWWTDMRDLMDYGSNDYTWISPRDVDNSGQQIPYDDLWNFFAKDTQQITVPTANGGQYYVYTGYIVSGPILTYFNKQGGLKKFGYPTSLSLPSSGSMFHQQFQHATIQCDFSNNRCSTT